MASCAVLSHPLSIINRGRIGISMTKVVKFININKLLTLHLLLLPRELKNCMKNYISEMYYKKKKEDSSGKNGALSANESFSNSVKDQRGKELKI